MDALPSELLLDIIRNVSYTDLYACSLVNRQFHSMTNPLLWHSQNIPDIGQFNKLIACMNASAASESRSPLGSLIRHIHLPSLTNGQFLTFMKHVNQLQDVMMEDASKLTDTSVTQLAMYCPKLKRLRLEYSNITAQSIRSLGTCQQLTELRLLGGPDLPLDALQALAACRLKTLNVHIAHELDALDGDDDPLMTPFGQQKINDTILTLTGFHHLTTLCLVHCPSVFVDQLFRTIATAATPVIWPRLMSVSLHGFNTLAESDALTFIRAHPDLIVFDLRPNTFSKSFLKVMARTLPDLMLLGLIGNTNITANAVRKLIKKCPMLETIYLTDAAINVGDFPEAYQEDDGDSFVDYLDEDAIMEIRQSDDDSEEWEDRQQWKEELYARLFETDSDD